MNNLNRKLNELRKHNPELSKLLDELLSYKDGQGDYTIDRYNLPDLDIDTILHEIQKARELEQKKSDVAEQS